MSFKIGIILEEPFSTPCALEPSCARRGYGVDVALLVCQTLNLNCSFSFFDSTAYGNVDLTTGNATGMVGAIVSGRYDTSLPVLTPTYPRSTALSFSALFFYTSVLFVTRAPEPIKVGRLSFAFQLEVYMVFLASFLLSAALITFIARKLEFFNRSESIFTIFTDMLLQMIKCEFNLFLTQSAAVRVLLIFWAGVSIVMMSAYTSMLCSRETVQDSDVPFTDFETFVACLSSDRCRIVVHTESSSIPQQLQYLDSAFGKQIQEAIKKNPVKVIPDESLIPNFILSQRSGIFWVWPASKGVFYYLSQNNRGCQFYTIDSPFNDFGAFGFRKGNQLLIEEIDRVALQMRQNGIAEYIETTYYTNGMALADCHDAWGGIRTEEFIGFSAMLSTFTFLGGGMGIGVFALVVELLFRRYAL